MSKNTSFWHDLSSELVPPAFVASVIIATGYIGTQLELWSNEHTWIFTQGVLVVLSVWAVSMLIFVMLKHAARSLAVAELAESKSKEDKPRRTSTSVGSSPRMGLLGPKRPFDREDTDHRGLPFRKSPLDASRPGERLPFSDKRRTKRLSEDSPSGRLTPFGSSGSRRRPFDDEDEDALSLSERYPSEKRKNDHFTRRKPFDGPF